MYRIIEEKRTITGTSKFYIQKRKRFLFWTWWEKITAYCDIAECDLVIDYESYKSAKRDLYLLNDSIETIVRSDEA
jgi:hypothetical protein